MSFPSPRKIGAVSTDRRTIEPCCPQQQLGCTVNLRNPAPTLIAETTSTVVAVDSSAPPQ
jgi:hypothetical protein